MTTGKSSFTVRQVGAATAAVVVTVLLAGCGGDSGSSPSVSPPPPPTGGGTSLNGNGGLWAGTVNAPGTTYDGFSMVGVYTKSGESRFWIYNGTHGGAGFMLAPGAMSAVSNAEFTGPYQGYSDGVVLPTGLGVETGDIDVTVDTTDGSLSGTYMSNDSGAAQDSASFSSLAYDQTTYNLGASQSTLLGNGGHYGFQYALNGTSISGTLTIAAGSDSKTDTITGLDTHACTYSGTAVVINSKYDAYDVTLNRSCLGSSLALSGIGVFYPAGTIALTDTFGMLLDDGASVGVEVIAQ